MEIIDDTRKPDRTRCICTSYESDETMRVRNHEAMRAR